MTDGTSPASVLSRLSPAALTLAVGFAMLDPPKHADGDAPLVRLQSAFWREDPEVVAGVYDRLGIRLDNEPGAGGKPNRRLDLPIPKSKDVSEEAGARRLLADKLTAGWAHPDARGEGGTGEPSARPKRPSRKRNQRHGLPLLELAARAGVSRDAMARALEHRGYLDLVPYGGRQKRRLVSKRAEAAGYGRNVDPSSRRSARLDGANRAVPFPVFYDERVPDLLDQIGFAAIRGKVEEIAGRRAKLAWVLEHHAYLPNDFIASLTGYSEPGVRKARRALG